MINIARDFCRENIDSIICEPSGKLLIDLEMDKKRPTYMKIVD
jgi:hypothetical protein